MAKLADSSGVVREKKNNLLRTFWPSPQDYNEAVQNPKQNLRDSELSSSTAELDKFGIPRPHTGMFASVYKMQSGSSAWALRFFLHNVPDQVERYSAIGAYLGKLNCSAFVPFDFQENGLDLLGSTFPILKMHWCNGEDLISWLQRNLTQTTHLEVFLDSWIRLMNGLSASGVAHGDLQHGNILIDATGIRLIDYDAMFVPALASKQSNELGHRNYQHPQRSEVHFASYLDNFSAWLIYLSVKMIKCDPGLWWELRGGDDCLLFRATDLEEPLDSDAFYILEAHPSEEVRESARLLRYLRSLRIESVPPLGEEVYIPTTFESLVVESDDEDADLGIVSDGTPFDPSSGSSLPARGVKRKRSRKKGGAPGGRYFGASSTKMERFAADPPTDEPPPPQDADTPHTQSPRPERKIRKGGDLLERLRPSQVLLYGAPEENLMPAVNQTSSSISSSSAVPNAGSPLDLSGAANSSSELEAPAGKPLDTAWLAAAITLVLVIVIALYFFWMAKGGNEVSPLERLTLGRKPFAEKSLLIYPVDWTGAKK